MREEFWSYLFVQRKVCRPKARIVPLKAHLKVTVAPLRVQHPRLKIVLSKAHHLRVQVVPSGALRPRVGLVLSYMLRGVELDEHEDMVLGD